MSKSSKNKAAAQGAEVAAEITAVVGTPAEAVEPTATPVAEEKQLHIVWGKKDLQGNPTRMVVKADDRVTNKGEQVIDPATGELVYLIRVHRAKRVWYGKGAITLETSVQAAPAEETPATV